jgi:hypothetical protein
VEEDSKARMREVSRKAEMWLTKSEYVSGWVRCHRGRDRMGCDGWCDEVFVLVLVLHGQEPGGFSNA